MTTRQITLTPELAATYLSKLYRRQRKVSHLVREYERAMLSGQWVDYNPASPIMLDAKTGAMYNGRQRCTAVVNTGVTIKELLDDSHDADKYFDLVDINLKRAPHQFITSSHATVRAGATRIYLWHEQAFNENISRLANRWQLHEIRETADRLDNDFEAWVKWVDPLYQNVHLSQGVMLAAMVIAADKGYAGPAESFVSKVCDPYGLDPSEPASLLHRKMNNTNHIGRRRQPVQDWLLFVRCLNAEINDESLPSTIYSNLSVWPDVGETEIEIRKKISRAANLKSVRTRVEKRVRAQIAAAVAAEVNPMAASG